MKISAAILIALVAVAALVSSGLSLTPNDPMLGQQPALTAIKASQAWDYETGGPTKVAIIGTGAGFTSTTIPDLPLSVVVTSDAPDPFDDVVGNYGASTSSASIIGSTGNNGEALAGVMWQSDIRVYKIVREGSNHAQVTDLDTAEAINDAVSWGAQVIQIDYAFTVEMPLTLVAVNAALFANRLVVIGVNSASAGLGYLPVNAGPELLVVAATDTVGNPLGYDGEGAQLDLVAPGNQVWARANAACCVDFSQAGTAAAFVTGVAGLLRDRLVGEWNVRRVLTAGATDLSPAGFDNATGYGLLNADCAMTMAGDMNNSLNVDITDAVLLVDMFGQPGGEIKYDVNNDGGIDLQDALISLAIFGAAC